MSQQTADLKGNPVPRLDDVLSMLGNAEQFVRVFVQLAFG